VRLRARDARAGWAAVASALAGPGAGLGAGLVVARWKLGWHGAGAGARWLGSWAAARAGPRGRELAWWVERGGGEREERGGGGWAGRDGPGRRGGLNSIFPFLFFSFLSLFYFFQFDIMCKSMIK
jgi:hypothetical protein